MLSLVGSVCPPPPSTPQVGQKRGSSPNKGLGHEKGKQREDQSLWEEHCSSVTPPLVLLSCIKIIWLDLCTYNMQTMSR